MSSAKGPRNVLERDVEAYLQEQVLAHGGFCYLVAPRGSKGPPDTVIVWPRNGWAQIHLAEVKTTGGALEEVQMLFHAALALMNCHVRVFWDRTQIDRYVEQYGSRTSTAGVTLAVLLEHAKSSNAYLQLKHVFRIPRRKKKPAIQLAPAPADEFAPVRERGPTDGVFDKEGTLHAARSIWPDNGE